MLLGCRTHIPPVVVETRTDSIYIERLVPRLMPADSASIRAKMECDEHGKVILRWLDLSNTKNVQLMFQIDSMGNVISNMVVPPDTIYVPSTETNVDRKAEVPVPVEKKLSRWQQFKMDVGGWAIGVLSAIIIGGLLYLIRRVVK